jgi:transposase-like protein
MEPAKPKRRRKHSAQLKERVVAACTMPGASVARIALEHGLNVNLVHRWRRVTEGREAGGAAPCPRVQRSASVRCPRTSPP